MKFNPDSWQWKNKDGVHLIEDIDDKWLNNIVNMLQRAIDQFEDIENNEDTIEAEYKLAEVTWLKSVLADRKDNPVNPPKPSITPPPHIDSIYTPFKHSQYEFTVVTFAEHDKDQRYITQATSLLNEFGKDGWQVAACNSTEIILQREVA